MQAVTYKVEISKKQGTQLTELCLVTPGKECLVPEFLIKSKNAI